MQSGCVKRLVGIVRAAGRDQLGADPDRVIPSATEHKMPDIYLYRPYTPQGSPTPSTPNSEHQHTSSDNSSRCSGAHHEHGGRTLQLIDA